MLEDTIPPVTATVLYNRKKNMSTINVLSSRTEIKRLITDIRTGAGLKLPGVDFIADVLNTIANMTDEDLGSFEVYCTPDCKRISIVRVVSEPVGLSPPSVITFNVRGPNEISLPIDVPLEGFKQSLVTDIEDPAADILEDPDYVFVIKLRDLVDDRYLLTYDRNNEMPFSRHTVDAVDTLTGGYFSLAYTLPNP